jgi:hypothetical protein
MSGVNIVYRFKITLKRRKGEKNKRIHFHIFARKLDLHSKTSTITNCFWNHCIN